MSTYRVLQQRQEFSVDDYSIVPIKFEDRFDIMKWRNDQIDILRQKKTLTEQEQDEYFNTIVLKLFEQEFPKQLLFSYLKNGKTIGYGGLVHIDWSNKNAEISFLLDTKLNTIDNYLDTFSKFLVLMEEVATHLKLHKIYTFGYDVADYRFEPLQQANYDLEAVLKEHIRVGNKLCDVKIYSRIII